MKKKVRRKGFCCDSVFDKKGINAPSAGSAMAEGQISSGDGQGSANNGSASPSGSGSRKVQCVDDGSRCVRCDPQLKKEVEKRKLKVEATEPLPIGGLLISGSTNWTMQAMSGNWDNMVMTSMPELTTPFQLEFQRLWRDFAHHPQLMSPPGAIVNRNGAE